MAYKIFKRSYWANGFRSEPANTIGDKEMDKILRVIAESVSAPVSGMGRQTVADNKSLLQVIGDLMLVSPEFQQEWIEAIEKLSMFHPDVSAAVDNISLANTPMTTTFDDGVSESLAQEMMQVLAESREKWYEHADGINGFIDDSLTQCAIAGCLSHEWIVNKNLNGINKVVLVNPRNILFHYDQANSAYIPVQKIPASVPYQNVGVLGTYKKLNKVTYRYLAMRRINEIPYAIPPFLSAMENVLIQRDMVKNIKEVIKKLGLLGFLKVMLNAPARKQGETDDVYDSRLKQVLEKNTDGLQKAMASGGILGFQNLQEIEMTNTTTNVDGAEALMEMNDRLVVNGLKQPLEMMNRKNSASETFARVMLAKFGRNLSKYQNLVATAVGYGDLMHLQLMGYPVKKVINEFDSVMLGDKSKEEEAYGKRIDNADKLYNNGTIDQVQRAQMLYFTKPALDKPLVDPNPPKTGTDKGGGADMPKKTSAENRIELPERFLSLISDEPEHGMGYHVVDVYTKAKTHKNVVVTNGTFAWMQDKIDPGDIILVRLKKKDELVSFFEQSLGIDLPTYQGYSCGHDHETEEAGRSSKHYPDTRRWNWDIGESFGVPKNEQKWWNNYNRDADKAWKKTTAAIRKALAANLSQIPAGTSKQAVEGSILYSVYSEMEKTWKPAVKEIVQKHVRDIYDYYRRSKKPWEDVAVKKKDIPDAVFNLTDIRAMQFYNNSDNFYLGKFIVDPDSRKRLSEFIKTNYLDNDTEIGNNPEAIKRAADAIGDQVELEDWKIRRVINTSVNRMRNTAAVVYMDQAEVTEFEVVGLSDQLQCEYCRNMNGKTMSIRTEMQKIERIVTSPPEDTPNISPFITSKSIGLKPADVKDLSGEALQDFGIGAPSYHGDCRCVVVVHI